MRKALLSAIALLLFTAFAFGQATINETGFAFQGYARDADGAAISNQAINVQISIYQPSNSPIYVEAHTSNVQTDTYGVFAIVVGRGTPSTGTFSNINFTAANYNIKIEVRPSGGSYVTISDAQLLSVAYAKAAQVAITANNGTIPGTVISYAGQSVPAGYLPCDGRALDAQANPQYAALYAAIGTTWGGTGITSFNLPDLRGQFLRGFDNNNGGEANRDPDKANRTNLAGGTTLGNVVGSYQGNDIQSHNHGISNDSHTHTYRDRFYSENTAATLTPNIAFDNTNNTTTGSAGSDIDNSPIYQLATTSPAASGITINNSGGNETRPKNAYVYFLIKL